MKIKLLILFLFILAGIYSCRKDHVLEYRDAVTGTYNCIWIRDIYDYNLHINDTVALSVQVTTDPNSDHGIIVSGHNVNYYQGDSLLYVEQPEPSGSTVSGSGYVSLHSVPHMIHLETHEAQPHHTEHLIFHLTAQ